MTYRLPDPPSDGRLPIVDLARQSVISVDNGTISRIPIPCMYRYMNDCGRLSRMEHDHLGWPDPTHPDDSCQAPPIPCAPYVFEPIDLEGEGYDNVIVVLPDQPSGVTANGVIEYDKVMLTINAMSYSAQTEDIETPIAIYATGSVESEGTTYLLRDVVTKGTLRIVAGPIE